MANWRKKIELKKFFTDEEDFESVQKAMNSVADELEDHSEFDKALIHKLRNISQGDDVITPVDYANKLIASMYDIADRELIWIE